MVDHLVLFKLTPDATDEQRADALAALRGLKDKIPGILDLTAGVNFSSRSQGFELGVFVRFTDRAALENYLPHPAHRGAVDTFVAPIKADVIVVDYEA